jgi:VCBS repeat-containing protein
VNSPCPDRPFQGQVAATSADGSTTTVATDAEGRFMMDLAAGTYTVSAVTSGGGPPTAKPQSVTVRDGSYTQVTLEVDTGIR